MLIQTALFGDGPLGREICGDEAGIRGLPASAIRDFWGTTYRPANTVVAIAGDLSHEEAVELAAAAFGTGQRLDPRRGAGARAARRTAAARRASATRRRRSSRSRSRPCAATTPTPGRSRCSTRCWATGCRAGCSSAVREEKGLAYDVSSGVVEYADAGALEISAGVDPAQLPAAIEAILAELVRLVDEPVPAEELAKAKAYLSGGLELRMDDTRHLASWIGGQEALHDRVYTLDEALAAVAAVTPGDVQRAGRPSCSTTTRCGWPSSRPGRYLRGLERHLRLAR